MGGWGRPTTIGSLYNGYGYGNQYPQQYGYGHQHSYGYKRPSYGYKKPSYRKKPYGYKSKYGKKPKEDQDWEEPKEETHEGGDWKDDTDQDWQDQKVLLLTASHFKIMLFRFKKKNVIFME